MTEMTIENIKGLIVKYQKLDVLNNSNRINMDYYPMLLDACDSKDGRDIISLLVRALWFYTAGGRLMDLNVENILKVELIRLVKLAEQRIFDLEKIINTYNNGLLQRAKVACGEKIAYRKDAGLEQVNELWKIGDTYIQIAEKLNISRATVANRIKELKRLEKLKWKEEEIRQ